LLAKATTFLAVVFAWVVFRADNISTAFEIQKSMLGLNGIILPPSYLGYLNHFFSLGNMLSSAGIRFEDNVPYFFGIKQCIFLLVLQLIVWISPNTYQMLGKYSPVLNSPSVKINYKKNSWLKWQPKPIIAIFFSLLFLIILFKMDATSEFLYFQF
jgi:hypothetical protein